jgi:hypothetical protein
MASTHAMWVRFPSPTLLRTFDSYIIKRFKIKCENCGEDHDGSYGSGRFCSIKCARGFSTKEKRKEIIK